MNEENRERTAVKIIFILFYFLTKKGEKGRDSSF
jgi:hypothetical protein